MRSTLFHIPGELAGLPVFGLGWLLIAWVLVGIAMLGAMSRRPGWTRDLAGYLPLWGIVAAVIVVLLPNMIEPIAGTDQYGLPIRGFGVMLLLATVTGVGMAAYRAWQVGIDPETIYSLAFWMFGAGILGARLFYIIQYWDQFQRDTLVGTLQAVLNVTQGGLVVYGSVIAGLPAGLWYVYRRGLKPMAVADIIAPSMVIGLALGRIGCFLNGCCYGGFCEAMPPGMTFPSESPPYKRQADLGWSSGVWLATAKRESTTMKPLETREAVAPETSSTTTVQVAFVAPDTAAEQAGVKEGDVVEAINGQKVESLVQAQEVLAAGRGVYEFQLADGRIARWMATQPPARSAPVHPAQLYAAIDAGLLAWVLWNFFPYRRRDGEVFALLITIHPVSRFLLEMIRSDEPGQFGTELTISQWISIAFLGVAAVLWWYIERPGNRAQEAGGRGHESDNHSSQVSATTS